MEACASCAPPAGTLLAHHAVLPVEVAEDGEAPPLPEPGHLLQGVVIDALGDDDGWRVRGTDGVVSVHGAHSPPVILQTGGRQHDEETKFWFWFYGH